MVKNWGEEATAGEGAAAPAKGEKKGKSEPKYIELDDGALPETASTIEGDIKTVVTYLQREDGKVEKKTRKYRLEQRQVKVSRGVMERRGWAKFGVSKGLAAGPDSASTNVVADDIYLVLSSKKNLKDDKEDSGDKTILAIKQALMNRTNRIGGEGGGRIASGVYVAPANRKAKEGDGAGGKAAYVPPSMRPGRGGSEAASGSSYQRDDTATIRVTNISENTRDDDLRELFRPFGPVNRCYLATDKETGLARGFAFINYLRREDAQTAIDTLNGHGYDHLILQVEWAEERKDR